MFLSLLQQQVHKKFKRMMGRGELGQTERWHSHELCSPAGPHCHAERARPRKRQMHYIKLRQRILFTRKTVMSLWK